MNETTVAVDTTPHYKARLATSDADSPVYQSYLDLVRAWHSRFFPSKEKGQPFVNVISNWTNMVLRCGLALLVVLRTGKLAHFRCARMYGQSRQDMPRGPIGWMVRFFYQDREFVGFSCLHPKDQKARRGHRLVGLWHAVRDAVPYPRELVERWLTEEPHGPSEEDFHCFAQVIPSSIFEDFLDTAWNELQLPDEEPKPSVPSADPQRYLREYTPTLLRDLCELGIPLTVAHHVYAQATADGITAQQVFGKA